MDAEDSFDRIMNREMQEKNDTIEAQQKTIEEQGEKIEEQNKAIEPYFGILINPTCIL